MGEEDYLKIIAKNARGFSLTEEEKSDILKQVTLHIAKNKNPNDKKIDVEK